MPVMPIEAVGVVNCLGLPVAKTDSNRPASSLNPVSVVPPLAELARRGESHERPAEVGEVFHGVAGCPGKVTGRARIVTDPAEPGDLEPEDILVAPLTDPAWTPLFMAVGGVVVDVGGQISHAIIVSRELGLPCVVSATGASARIPDGALIEVDADHGTVTVLEMP